MSKSYVAVEQHCCQVCGKTYDTGAVLLDKRMRDRFEDGKAVTGWGLCPEHQALFDQGYIAIVAVDEAKSEKTPNGNINPAGAYRTGNIAHVRRSVAPRIFNVPFPDDLPLVFCEDEVVTKLRKMMEGTNDAE